MKDHSALKTVNGEPARVHLKPCPFCGQTDQLRRLSDMACWVRCARCLVEGPPAASLRSAAMKWNKRATELTN